jgi:CheY-like chemotaxis protein
MSNIESPKFIVIDDDNINNFLVRGVLKQLSSSSEVECFTNPQLALDHLIGLENKKYKDLIIFLDLNMPIMDGYQVLI